MLPDNSKLIKSHPKICKKNTQIALQFSDSLCNTKISQLMENKCFLSHTCTTRNIYFALKSLKSKWKQPTQFAVLVSNCWCVSIVYCLRCDDHHRLSVRNNLEVHPPHMHLFIFFPVVWLFLMTFYSVVCFDCLLHFVVHFFD